MFLAFSCVLYDPGPFNGDFFFFSGGGGVLGGSGGPPAADHVLCEMLHWLQKVSSFDHGKCVIFLDWWVNNENVKIMCSQSGTININSKRSIQSSAAVIFPVSSCHIEEASLTPRVFIDYSFI